MSVDNGIYIAKFPTCWRICYGSAIENIEHYPVGTQERLLELSGYFGQSEKYNTEDEAVLAAHRLAKDYEYLEYGVSVLPGVWDEFDPDALPDFSGFTNMQMLEYLVPDIREKLNNAPESFKKVLNERIQSQQGFRPLEWMKGCM